MNYNHQLSEIHFGRPWDITNVNMTSETNLLFNKMDGNDDKNNSTKEHIDDIEMVDDDMAKDKN